MYPVPKSIKIGTQYEERCCTRLRPGHYWTDHLHKGVDFLAPVGTPVYATWNGIVTEANWGSAFGKHLVIDHDRFPDGKPGLWAVYAHLSLKKVKPGTKVRAGQVIGFSGRSGNVTGPHLHFEVHTQASWSRSSHYDPYRWLIAGEPVKEDSK